MQQVRGCRKISIFCDYAWQALHVAKMAISKSGLGSLRGGAFAPDAPPLATGLGSHGNVKFILLVYQLLLSVVDAPEGKRIVTHEHHSKW